MFPLSIFVRLNTTKYFVHTKNYSSKPLNLLSLRELGQSYFGLIFLGQSLS